MAHFISLDELEGLTPVEHDGAAVSGQYERLAARLEQVAPDSVGLFAEPVRAGRADQTNQVSWYSRYEGEPVPYSSLKPEEQAPAGQAIRRALDELVPLLRDAEFGPFLGRCLLVPDLEDVLLIGGRPVLRNWGWILPEFGTGPAGLQAAWDAGLGRFNALDRAPWAMVAQDRRPTVAEPVKPAGPPWWRRPAIALPMMAVLLLAGGGASYAFWQARMPPLDDAAQAERAQMLQRHGVLTERIGAFSGALKAGLCTPEAAETAALDAASATRLLQHAMGRVIVPGMANPVRGTAFFVAKDRAVMRSSALDGVGDRPIFLEAVGTGGTFRAEPVRAGATGPFVLLRLPAAASFATPLPLGSGLVPGTPTYAGALPAFANNRDDSFYQTLKGDLDEAPIGVVSRAVLDPAAADGAVPAPSVPAGADGGPVIDSCGRVIGVIGAAQSKALPATPLNDMLHPAAASPCLAVPDAAAGL